MEFTVLTIFPESFDWLLKTSLLGKAIQKGIIKINVVNIRDFSEDKHKRVDDTPYGGGSGMVMKIEPLVKAIEEASSGYKILLSPKGKRLNQNGLTQWTQNQKHMILICGRYEGIDARINYFIDEEISVGDFILSGGEIGAMAIIEATSRLIDGVVGNVESLNEESFNDNLLEYPQYTRPEIFRDLKIPDVLLSGNHKNIATWRKQQQLLITFKQRPELIDKSKLSKEDIDLIKNVNGDDI